MLILWEMQQLKKSFIKIPRGHDEVFLQNFRPVENHFREGHCWWWRQLELERGKKAFCDALSILSALLK
jgi:hypothetical protein